MASDVRSKGYQSGFGALLEGLREGSDDFQENRFKRDAEIEKRRFDVAKMQAQNQFQRQQQDERLRQHRELFNERTQQSLMKKKKEAKVDPNDLVAFTTGKFTPQMVEKLGQLPLEDQVAVIRELAKAKGFKASGEREEDTGEKEGGIFGFGAKPVKKKIPVYSQSENQFQR